MISGTNQDKAQLKRQQNTNSQRIVRRNRALTIELGHVIKENYTPGYNATLIAQAKALETEADLWTQKANFLSEVLLRAESATNKKEALNSTSEIETSEPCSKSSYVMKPK